MNSRIAAGGMGLMAIRLCGAAAAFWFWVAVGVVNVDEGACGAFTCWSREPQRRKFFGVIPFFMIVLNFRTLLQAAITEKKLFFSG